MATLRKESKRHFVDPSLAAAALNVGPTALQRNPVFTGLLFESLVVQHLRVFPGDEGCRDARTRLRRSRN
ncbi:DUF4143 domain-containing protein [Leucobacter coleopterorum]|uniref:DUF4143 domain-containing protein n=1 Tax=Leucobacter coleopterorum TaxID=2714933 RepID=A0ABX6K2R0_9MICO|nr:DUF4143 domain-containing protein [Leucobacter coleopterorum]